MIDGGALAQELVLRGESIDEATALVGFVYAGVLTAEDAIDLAAARRAVRRIPAHVEPLEELALEEPRVRDTEPCPTLPVDAYVVEAAE